MTWQELLALEPSLREWEIDARSVAQNARWGWYPLWLPGYRVLLDDLRGVATRHGLDFGAVRRVAESALLETYATERERVRRKARA
jgi:hypothetical protein